MATLTTGEWLEAHGFDLCGDVVREAVRVRCSQCEALVINGYPTHEAGCPNQTRACRECDGGRVRGRFATVCDGCLEAQAEYDNATEVCRQCGDRFEPVGDGRLCPDCAHDRDGDDDE